MPVSLASRVALTPASSDKKSRSCRRPRFGAVRALNRGSGAFTRLECLACLAAVVLLALLAAPLLAATPGRAHGVVCSSNLGRLLMAWTQSAQDNDGRLPSFVDGTSQGGLVSGWLDFGIGSRDNTNTLNLLDPRLARLGPYVAEAGTFKCPSDTSTVRFRFPDGSLRGVPRVRSYAANNAMNGPSSFLGGGYRTYARVYDIVLPPPSRAWVFVDEHPGSINDAAFAVRMPASPAAAEWVDMPAAHHDGAGALSFADGHVELHRWVDPRTRVPFRDGSLISAGVVQPNNPDILWFTERTSARR